MDDQTSLLFKAKALQEVPSLQLCQLLQNGQFPVWDVCFHIFIIPCRSYLVALRAISHRCCVERKPMCSKTDGRLSAWLKMYETCRQACGAFYCVFSTAIRCQQGKIATMPLTKKSVLNKASLENIVSEKAVCWLFIIRLITIVSCKVIKKYFKTIQWRLQTYRLH